MCQVSVLIEACKMQRASYLDEIGPSAGKVRFQVSGCQNCFIDFLLFEAQVSQGGHRAGVAHCLAEAEEIPAKGLMNILRESLPHAVGACHPGDACRLERAVKDSPRGGSGQPVTVVLPASEKEVSWS
jgi:hypothetical protein